jgi:putative oligomerization/nucleic acid binding protein
LSTTSEVDLNRSAKPLGTCEGCGLEVTEGTECPDCGAAVIWPELPPDDVLLQAEITIHEVEDVAEALTKLAALFEKGLLTEAEFAAAKRRVLAKDAE